MKSRNQLSVAKWPFFVADAILVAAAGLTLWFSAMPPPPAAVATAVLLLVFGVVVSLTPYLVESFWNWQAVEEEKRAQMETQQQAVAKMAAQIAAIVSSLEQTGRNGADEEGRGDVFSKLEEVAQTLGDWQSQVETRAERFAVEMEQVFREERKKREEFRQFLEGVLEPLAKWSDRASAATDDSEVEPLREEEIEEEESASEPEVATAQLPLKKRKLSALKKVRTESGGSLFSTTTLVATAFIGPSKKLYLRGEGPGLSWDVGVPMRFMEIGKWSWTTTEAIGPIRVQVYKNDEEPDKSGISTVEPGQTLSLRPEFEI